MPETKTITFSYKEVVLSLIKQQDLHEGIWQLYFEFNLKGGNIETAPEQASPAAFVLINKIGLMRVEKENLLTIDASKENPSPKGMEK